MAPVGRNEEVRWGNRTLRQEPGFVLVCWLSLAGVWEVRTCCEGEAFSGKRPLGVDQEVIVEAVGGSGWAVQDWPYYLQSLALLASAQDKKDKQTLAEVENHSTAFPVLSNSLKPSSAGETRTSYKNFRFRKIIPLIYFKSQNNMWISSYSQRI